MDRKRCKTGKYLTKMVVISLRNVMEQLAAVFFGFHQQKDQEKKSKARMKVIEEKYKPREDNKEM